MLHESFNERQKQFVETLLAADEAGTPKLFKLSNEAALDVIEVGYKIGIIHPQKIIDPLSGRNFILQAAHWGNKELLNKIIELFPDAFLSSGLNVIEEILQRGHSKDLVYGVALNFYKLGGALDTYCKLWLQVALSITPNEEFKQAFALISPSQQRTLYDAAFIYNNPFIYEPADPPVPPELYSINLMWINKNKMPGDQEFLFGNGSTFEQREADFENRFVKPVSKWAQKNPGSFINIWVDSDMATSQAIERSRIALQTALEGTAHGKIQFRDVRTIDTVQTNPDAFSDIMPIYFRVDLLRAIAADYILRKKENKFFVYGDIDMEPLSATELFDKRTVSFLTDYGFVLAKGGFHGFENGFQILNGDNSQLMNSHRKVIIDLSIEMVLEKPKEIREQQVYDSYKAMLTHFLDADGRYGKFIDLSSRCSKPKTQLKDPLKKLKHFRYDRFNQVDPYLPLDKEYIEFKEIMPRKPVRLPPTHYHTHFPALY